MTQNARQLEDVTRPPDHADREDATSNVDTGQHSTAAPPGWWAAIGNMAAPTLLVVSALAVGAALISSPPDVPKSEPETLAPVVGVAELVPRNEDVFVTAFGTVVPAREIRIIPEVTGRIIERNDRLEPGGLIAKGERLFRIDPAEYEIAVAQAEADREVAQHEVARLRAGVESLRGRGRQFTVEIAYLQWNANRLGNLTEQDSAAESEARDATTKLESQRAALQSLNAQIEEQENAVGSAVARVRAAERRLAAAQLALERTVVSLPFDAIVVAENVEIGQLVGTQSPVATLVATDEFWVEAAVPVSRLRDMRFAEEGVDRPSRVFVNLATNGDGIVREGMAVRPLGDLDPLGRMAKVLVSIHDPLGLVREGSHAGRRILLGSYVRLQIEAGILSDVYSIPRKALRENDRVWVRDAEGRLAIRPVEIVWRRHEDVLVRDGFEADDRLVTTHLASVIPGMPLRVRYERPANVESEASSVGSSSSAVDRIKGDVPSDRNAP